MLSFANLQILYKLILAFVVVLLFAAGLGVFAINRIGMVTTVADGLEANIAGTTPIQAMARSGPLMLDLASETVLTTDAALQPRLAAAENAERARFAANWALYQPTMDPGRETHDGDGFSGIFRQMSTAAAEVAKDVAAGNRAAAAALVSGQMADLNPIFDQDIEDDLAYQKLMAAGHASAISLARSSSETDVFLVLGFMVLAIFGMVFLLIVNMGRPIAGLTRSMRRMAAGEMNIAIPGAMRGDEIGEMARAVQVFKDAGLEKIRMQAEMEASRQAAEAERRLNDEARESAAQRQQFVVSSLATGLGQLAGGGLLFRLDSPFGAGYEKLRVDFNAAMQKLQETMLSITGATYGVGSAANEITLAADDLARRTEMQAASLEETAVALDQITTTIKKTVEHTTHAQKVVSDTHEKAELSSLVIQKTVTAMGDIEKSSKEIGAIIGVIDEIAFQTNLLALNAGIEAARAGDAGRGFAVVATEVRALAQRSADAAKEIKQLISASGKQVGIGVRLVDDTGKALNQISEQVAQLNLVFSGITASAQEQASGLAEINLAVNQMDQVTQQNAAMVEQASAASHSLTDEASELTRMVRQFEIGQLRPQAEAPGNKPIRLASSPSAENAIGNGKVVAIRNNRRLGTDVIAANADWQEL